MMHTRLFAVMATVGLILFALGPGVATVAADSAGNDSLDVSVSQVDAEPTVTVTDNDAAVENATVSVAVLGNGSYEGAGEDYSTDANGTVTLSAPEENVSVEVTATAGNATGSTTADLTAAAENESKSFGDRVSAFVQSLLAGNTDGIGQQVAGFATENNPGNALAWAGPPEGGDHGPPEHAGQDDDETAENGTDDDRRGPPADAGPSDDSDDADDLNETDDTGDDSDDDNTADDDSGGPPEQARGN